MTRLPRLHRSGWLLLALLLPRLAYALDTTAWQNQQSVTIEHPGVVKLTLPPATLDAARPALEDLRLLDPSGRETPFLIDYAAPTTRANSQRPKSIRGMVAGLTTQLVIETGTAIPLTGVVLVTPNPSFLKPARIETSNDGETWQTAQSGVPLFRQFGAEQLQLELPRVTAAYLRITIDDSRSRAIPFTGASLLLVDTAQPAPTSVLPDAHIGQHDEFTGETVLMIDLGARHIPVDSIQIATNDPLFTRKVTIGIRELRDEMAVERTVASGTIYRVAVDGIAPSAKLDVPVPTTAQSRELLIHIVNGDSPPLVVTAIEVRQRPVWLVFAANAAGSYTLLTGNPEASSPRYDVSSLADTLRQTPPSPISVGKVESNPAFQPRDTLANAPLLGGPIDPSAWRCHKPVQIQSAGVQQLDLDVDVLAGTQNNLGDLRLVRNRTQVPYVLERPSSTRSLRVSAELDNDPNRPRISRWRIRLPRAGIPITRLTLTTPAVVFQRHIRVFENVPDENGSRFDRALVESDWFKTSAAGPALNLSLTTPIGDTLYVETDNGDNPPLALGAVGATYPVARLIFKSEVSPLTLYYGNRDARAPQYDIALVAPQLLGAEKKIATLGPEEVVKPSRWENLQALRGGALFWGALALVVLVLLIVVAKLLPKPPPA